MSITNSYKLQARNIVIYIDICLLRNALIFNNIKYSISIDTVIARRLVHFRPRCDSV